MEFLLFKYKNYWSENQRKLGKFILNLLGKTLLYKIVALSFDF